MSTLTRIQTLPQAIEDAACDFNKLQSIFNAINQMSIGGHTSDAQNLAMIGATLAGIMSATNFEIADEVSHNPPNMR